MEHVLEAILEAEKKAENTIREARNEAQRISREADLKSNEILDQAKKEAQEFFVQKVTEAETRSKNEYRESIDKEQADTVLIKAQKQAEIEDLIEKIAESIIHSPFLDQAV